MATRIEEFLAYVPLYVARQLAAEADPDVRYNVEHFPAALLFADVSGFSRLSQHVDRFTEEGAEELTRLLNSYYGPLVELVAAHGGDVIRFAGDALLAMWPATGGALEQCAAQAVQAGMAIQEKLFRYPVADNVQLSLRVSIGAGDVSAARIGGVEDYWQLVVVGPTLEQVRSADKLATPGEVVVSGEVHGLLQGNARSEPRGEQYWKIIEFPVTTVAPPCALDVHRIPRTALNRFLPRTLLAREAVGLDWLAELRQVTTVFVNIDNPQKSVSDDAALLHTAMQHLQRAMQQYGGTVVQLMADDKGVVGICCFGLPPAAREAEALRAVHAAWAIRDMLAEDNLQCGIGIARGRVFCGSLGSDRRREYTVMGTTVNCAARLMQSAVDDVLCGEEVRLGVATSAEPVHFAALPVHRLKGFDDLVAVFRPMTAGNRESTGEQTIGRQHEMRVIDELLDDVQQGSCPVLYVDGEPGIGKSRLAKELLQRAERRRILNCCGECRTIQQTAAYLPWRAILHRLIDAGEGRDRTTREARVRSLLTDADWAHELLALLNAVIDVRFPETQLSSQLEGRNRADSLQRLLLELVRATSRDAELLIVLDDVQWMDSASWKVALAIHSEQLAAFVLISRPLTEAPPDELLTLQQRPGYRRLRLGFLDRRELSDLLTHRLGLRRVGADLVDYFVASTSGNPFFTQELVKLLVDTRRLFIEEGEPRIEEMQTGAAPVPVSVSEVITSRIDQLPAASQVTLKVLSVIGRDCPVELLSAVHPLNPARDQLLAELSQLSEREFIQQVGGAGEPRWGFRHLLFQQCCYKLTPHEQRKRLHAAVARWCEEHMQSAVGRATFLAHHWGAAEEHEQELKYLGRSGIELLQHDANREAIAVLEQALARENDLKRTKNRSESRLQRAHWERLLAEARFKVGDLSGSLAHLQTALARFGQRSPRSKWECSWAALREVFTQAWHRIRPRTMTRRDNDHTDDDGHWTDVRILQEQALASQRFAQICYFRSELLLGTIHALRALNRAESAGNSPGLARSYADLCIVAVLLRFPRLAELYAAYSERVARESAQLAAITYSLSVTSVYRLAFCQWDRVRETAQEAVRFSEKLNDQRRLAEAVCTEALLACFEGRFDASRAFFERVHAIGAGQSNPLHQGWGLCGSAECLFRLGQTAEAIERLNAAAAVLDSGDTYNEDIRVQGLLASCHWRSGRCETAVQHADRTWELLQTNKTATSSTLEGLAGMCDVYLRAWERNPQDDRLRQAARNACRKLAVYARVFPVGRPRSDHLQGTAAWIAGRPKRAWFYWSRSIRRSRELRLPMEEALTSLEIALRGSSEADDTREHARRAAEIFAQLGMRHELGVLQGSVAAADAAATTNGAAAFN